MPFILAPFAVAGYMYYKKRKEEKAKSEDGEQETQLSNEENGESTWDMIDSIDGTSESPSSPSLESSTEDLSNSIENASRQIIVSQESIDEQETPTVSPRDGATNAMGPVGRWRKFCTNLEKEYEKSQQRKAPIVAVDCLKKEYENSQQCNAQIVAVDCKANEFRLNDLDDQKTSKPIIASSTADAPKKSLE